MKTINRFQYFLFALILLGMFASFAQNEYSSVLLSYPYLFIGLLFFVEMCFSINKSGVTKSSAFYSFVECLSLGLFFCGTFLFAVHWSGAVTLMLVGAFIILFLYSGLGIKALLDNFRTGNKMSLILFCLTFGTCLAMIAYTFHVQHWALAGLLTVSSTVFSFIFILLVMFNLKMRDETEKIGFRNFLRKIKTRLLLSYLFFSFWTTYITLASFGFAPGLYSLANPLALEKMYREQNPAAEVYRKNYEHFLENRAASNKNHWDKTNSKK